MIEVKLLDNNKLSPERMANHAAKICYNSKILDIETEKMIDVENQLFKPGHHTTFEHQLFNFEIEGIAVADLIFGLHLLHPFYTTDQRSGRYSKMFDSPDFEEIQKYINFFYKESDNVVKEILEYVKFSYELYFKYIDKATDVVKKLIVEERLNDEEYIEKGAKKLAQEQLRSFLPMISLTGLVHSMDLISLVSIYNSSVSPAVDYVTEKMKDEVLKKFPELVYLFKKEEKANIQTTIFENNKEENKYLEVKLEKEDELKTSPECIILNMNINNIVVPDIKDCVPIDKTYFSPKYLNNSVNNLRMLIEISTGATMGQDQRHRAIKRTLPHFTGNFYLAPIVNELGVKNEVKELVKKWKSFYGKISNNLFYTIAPYGAMVRYEKLVDVNALSHEQLKRLCWCAQEEIYNLNRQLRNQIEKTGNTELLKIFFPPCMKEGGRCFEGDRWCRRKKMDKENPCPPRKI